jgi:hypothetical protein
MAFVTSLDKGDVAFFASQLCTDRGKIATSCNNQGARRGRLNYAHVQNKRISNKRLVTVRVITVAKLKDTDHVQITDFLSQRNDKHS